MKTIRSIFLFCLTLGLLFLGCTNVTESNSKESQIPNNLSESTGDNELENKKFSNENFSLKFEGNSVTYSAGSTGDYALRTASWSELSKFKYSWNSSASPKTLEFQLQQVWGTGVAQGYEEQVNKAKTKVSSVATAVNTPVSSDTLYTAIPLYKDKVKTQVSSKVTSYVDAQQNLLTTYLKNKYESVIKLNYTLQNATLTLTEVFKKDLTDATSRLSGESGAVTITLNDYSNLIPFKVEVGEKTYVGVPKISATSETGGTISVQLYPYYGNMMEDASVASSITTQITGKITSVLTNEEQVKSIIGEYTNSGTSSTLDTALDEAIGGQELQASYVLADDGARLTLTKVPSFMTSLKENAEVILTHKPLLAARLNLEK